MTTIACSLKEMAADTKVNWEGICTDIYSSIKLFTTKSAIYGVTGGDCTGSIHAIEWLQDGAARDFRPKPRDEWDWTLIELSPEGIALYNTNLERETTLEPCLAVGSGRKVAYYCMKYLGMPPAEAVREACKVDNWSGAPIYVASLRTATVKRWTPTRSKPKKGSK